MFAAKLCVDLHIANEEMCDEVIALNGPDIIYIVEHAENATAEDICGMTENPTLKVLHLADTHFDPKYSPGANITCDQMYLCCREGSGTPEDPNDGAGFWGSMGNCDIPRWSLEALYQYISDNNPDIDFIIWTGDIVPHNSWSTSREYNLDVINEMADLVSSYFPGIPVFPAVGNHEANPANLFPQPYITDPDFDISWLYDELNEIWQRWLPSDVAKSVAYGAFYSTQIRPGLRIASVNTQYCYINQFDAEDKGDFVYIIGHIPAGSFDCNYAWSHEFNKNYFQLYFDPQNSSRVYEIAYIAQSQTTFVDLNPGFKIYTIEGDFNGTRYRVIDHENWYLDLEQSNSINDSLPDLSPRSWLDLVYRMNEPNSTLFSDFYSI
ncbi:Sphingomyelin phosphodiesterase [Armadillidium vulgare]|nr:Sphingomyelin phosphodiesterase [Armadillidium vulgare]